MHVQNNTILLNDYEYAKVKKYIFDDKGMFVEGMNVTCPDGAFGHFHVHIDDYFLDINMIMVLFGLEIND